MRIIFMLAMALWASAGVAQDVPPPELTDEAFMEKLTPEGKRIVEMILKQRKKLQDNKEVKPVESAISGPVTEDGLLEAEDVFASRVPSVETIYNCEGLEGLHAYIHGMYQRTQLHYEALENDALKIKQLVLEGAEVDPRDLFTMTPIMYAAREGNYAAVETLLDAGADPTLEDANGQNSLDYAITFLHDDIATLLRPHVRDILDEIREDGIPAR